MSEWAKWARKMSRSSTPSSGTFSSQALSWRCSLLLNVCATVSPRPRAAGRRRTPPEHPECSESPLRWHTSSSISTDILLYICASLADVSGSRSFVEGWSPAPGVPAFDSRYLRCFSNSIRLILRRRTFQHFAHTSMSAVASANAAFGTCILRILVNWSNSVTVYPAGRENNRSESRIARWLAS